MLFRSAAPRAVLRHSAYVTGKICTCVDGASGQREHEAVQLTN